MIAAKFGGQEEINKAGLTMLLTPVSVLDAGALATLAPVPPITPDVRIPLPPLQPDLTGEAFSQLVTAGSSAAGAGFSTTATNNGAAADTAALAVREIAATVPDLWDSPEGTAALSGRLTEHANALTTISDRWFELGERGEEACRRLQPDGHRGAQARGVQGQRDRAAAGAGRREQHRRVAAHSAARCARTARPYRSGSLRRGNRDEHLAQTHHRAPDARGGCARCRSPRNGWSRHLRRKGSDRRAPLAKAGATEASQAGQAGDAAGQLAQLLPAALGAIGGLAGGAAGMVGQIPQALTQTGQGLAQTATQGLSGLASKKPSDAEFAKYGAGLKPDELSKAKAGGGAVGGGAGDTHPAGALGPPVTPSTSHTPPTMPAGAAQPRANPTPAGGSAMGAMPMGMPLGGLMPHAGQGGDGGADKVTADKKVVVPPQPHTETVTGKVSDRTAAAAAASRNRGESEDPDDGPPRGPILRRITLAPLHDEGHQ